MLNTTTAVLLATSWAPLLSGLLHQCLNADDPSCNGGVAAFSAMLRHHSKLEAQDNQNDALPFAHIQLLDKDSAFVHMHPLGLSVNRLILNGLMGLDVFASSPSILLQNNLDSGVSSQDISYLQTHDMPLLISNVGVPPSNSWHPYTKAVHFDAETRLAILSLSMSTEALNVPAAMGGLRYIRKVNEENGCVKPSSSYHTLLSDYFSHSNVTTTRAEETDSSNCWLPIVYHSDKGDQFASFLTAMLALPRHHRPAMIIDTAGSLKEYEEPTLVDGIWVASPRLNSRTFFQHKLEMSYDAVFGLQLDYVEFTSAALSPLPDEMKDETYRSEILALKRAADEALRNNPVIGYSDEMPFARDSTSYRPCKSGECPIGNLFTDAARWYTNADVAFITSGGVRGPGWAAGDVHVSDLYEALPFTNKLCTGRMNGVHLFQLLNYSMSVATFEGEDTDDGGKLLQSSGLKVTYNTELSQSRIIEIEVLDRESGQFKPIDRLQIYEFATDSYLCDGYKPFPSLLGSDNLVVEGEQPGTIIEGVLFQEMAADFLNATTSIDAPYNTTTQNRLVNDTAATEVLNLIQSEDSCAPGEYWESDIQTCMHCPVNFDVTFSKKLIEFEATDQERVESITLTNNEDFYVAIIPKKLPDWLVLDSVESVYAGSNIPTILGAGESLQFSMSIISSELEEGTVYVTIAFGVLDGGDYHGCVGSDAGFDITMRVLPTEQLNQLGSIRAAGFTLFGIIAITSISFAVFVICHRQQQVVKALQPIFLLCICGGVLVLGSSIIPLSIDDELASQRGCDISCMALPWLICLGFSVAISALFAKLWRINKLFTASRSCRRVQVRVQDVAMPLVVLLVANITILICWTLIDPLVYKRFEMMPWSTYGRCVGSSNASNILLIIVGVLNGVVLFLALVQAWKARNISDEFSETKIVGSALYGWLQLLIVGVPVLFLISDDNTTARYFVLVALIFLVSMSMLLIIFVPLFIQIRRAQVKQKVQVVSHQMDSQSQQIGSRSSAPPRKVSQISGINGKKDFNSAPKVPYPFWDMPQGGGQGQEIQESSANGAADVAAALPV